MQLIKNRFFADRGKENDEARKARKKIEIAASLKLEKDLTAKLGSKQAAKERVAELYFNQISFGRDRFGIEEGARKIFGKSVSDLNVLEAAALAAMPKDPSAYDPSRHPKKNRTRRLTVLQEMKKLGNISEDEIKAVFAEYGPRLGKEIPVTGGFEQDFKTLLTLDPITVKDANPFSGTAQNICDMAKDNLRKKYCAGMNLKDKNQREVCEEKLSDLGITIRSSVSQKLMAVVTRLAQNTATTIKGRHEMHKEAPQVAVVVVDNETGEIPVLVSGTHYSAGGFNFSFADRQPGSLIKALVYYAGFRYASLSPESMMTDAPVMTMNGKPWPANYEPEGMGTITLLSAFEHSVNTIAVKVLIAAGPKNIVNVAREFGITSELKADYSLALGTYGIAPIQIAGLYATFARGGLYIKPTIFTEIGGERVQHMSRQVVSPVYEGQMKELFYGVVQSGTGTKVKSILPFNLGGKTGTTSGHADAWFAGFTPRYTIVVWIGFEKRTTLGAKETGAQAALPLWGDVACIMHTGHDCGLVAAMPTKKVDDREDRKQVEEAENPIADEEQLITDDNELVDDTTADKAEMEKSATDEVVEQPTKPTAAPIAKSAPEGAVGQPTKPTAPPPAVKAKEPASEMERLQQNEADEDSKYMNQ